MIQSIFSDLVVQHVLFKKNSRATPASIAWKSPEFCFRVETCQRVLLLGFAPSRQVLALSGFDGEIETYHGRNAYQFLLSFSCGLESELVGETDVFGQLKTAWKKHQELDHHQRPHSAPSVNQEESRRMAQLVHYLFEDTKEFRTRFVHGLGGHTYGSLVRKLAAQDPLIKNILLVGAGELARTVAPYIQNFSTRVFNRSIQRRDELLVEFSKLTPYQEHDRAWKPDFIVITTPWVRENADLWTSYSKSGTLVLHLGILERPEGCGQIMALRDLFALQDGQSEIRRSAIARIHHAIVERSKLRDLGGSISIPHGWEDLANFA